MAPSGESPAVAGPLTGEALFLIGRMNGLTRRRVEQLVMARGGRLAGKPGTHVTLVAIGHSAAASVRPDGSLPLAAALSRTALVSERGLRRRLGLLAAPEATERSLRAADLERLAVLTPARLACLALFDVVEPVNGTYSYRDLVAAREAGRLIGRGVELRKVLEAAIALRRRGGHLAEARLTESPSGALVREFDGGTAELDGQLTIPLDSNEGSVDDLVAAAETAAEHGRLADAERLYSTALRADSDDPVLAFSLGNVFDAQGRPAEAKIAWRMAVARDPALAEAWYNLALAAESENRPDRAVAEYRRAAQAQPDYADALFNLALLLTKLDRCAEALPVWEQFLKTEPHSPQAGAAKRALALCRMSIHRRAREAG